MPLGQVVLVKLLSSIVIFKGTILNVIIAYYSLTKTIIMDELTLYEDKLIEKGCPIFNRIWLSKN